MCWQVEVISTFANGKGEIKKVFVDVYHLKMKLDELWIWRLQQRTYSIFSHINFFRVTILKSWWPEIFFRVGIFSPYSILMRKFVPLRPGAPPRQYPCYYAGPEGGSRCFSRVVQPADLVLGAKDAHVTAPPLGPTRLRLGVFWVQGTPVATSTGGGGGGGFGEGWQGFSMIFVEGKTTTIGHVEPSRNLSTRKVLIAKNRVSDFECGRQKTFWRKN